MRAELPQNLKKVTKLTVQHTNLALVKCPVSNRMHPSVLTMTGNGCEGGGPLFQVVYRINAFFCCGCDNSRARNITKDILREFKKRNAKLNIGKIYQNIRSIACTERKTFCPECLDGEERSWPGTKCLRPLSGNSWPTNISSDTDVDKGNLLRSLLYHGIFPPY